MADGYVSTSNSGFNSPVSAGGKSTSAFGAINFGANSTLGGATTSASDSTGSSMTVVYVAIGALVLYLLFKR